MPIEIGNITKGKIVKVLNFGAIVKLEGGSTGLIHISEIADTYIKDINEYVKENDEVTVKVLRSGKEGRFDLSLKQCLSSDFKHDDISADVNKYKDNEKKADLVELAQSTFEDRLSKYMKESEERQMELKRHFDSKRGRKRI